MLRTTSTAFDQENVWHLSTIVVGPLQWFCDMETKFESLELLSHSTVDSVVHICDFE